MSDWQSKLYAAYVSTGQASGTESATIRLEDHPQHLRIIRRYMPQDRTLRILDLACGHGTLVFCLRELGYTNVEGVDVSREQVELAHRRGIHEVSLGSMTDHLRDRKNAWDVIVLMDVLEHLDKPAVMELLELVHRSLTERGRLILHVPNGEGRFGMRVRYGDFTHQGCFTSRSIRQVLAATGFRRVAVYEEKPLVHGVKSLLRRVLWSTLTLNDRLLLLAETGTWNHVLSQNMLVTAERSA